MALFILPFAIGEIINIFRFWKELKKINQILDGRGYVVDLRKKYMQNIDKFTSKLRKLEK